MKNRLRVVVVLLGSAILLGAGTSFVDVAKVSAEGICFLSLSVLSRTVLLLAAGCFVCALILLGTAGTWKLHLRGHPFRAVGVAVLGLIGGFILFATWAIVGYQCGYTPL